MGGAEGRLAEAERDEACLDEGQQEGGVGRCVRTDGGASPVPC